MDIKPTKNRLKEGLLYPFSAYYDPIFGFRQNIFLEDFAAQSEALAAQTLHDNDRQQPWRKNRYGATQNKSKYRL